MTDFKAFLKANRASVMALAMKNTHINTEGMATISRDSEWASESVWDSDYEELTKVEHGQYGKIAVG